MASSFCSAHLLGAAILAQAAIASAWESGKHCLEAHDEVNSSQILQLVASAHGFAEECGKQVLQQLCRRLDFVTAREKAADTAAPAAEVTMRASASLQHELTFQVLEPVRVAFLVLAFGALENLRRLLSRLRSPSHYFLLHLDRKASWRRVRELRQRLSEEEALTPPRLRVMEERFDVRRGGASFLLVLLRGLEVLLHSKEVGNWEYFVNLNDNDYPISTNQAFQAYLQLHRSESFVHVGSPSQERCPDGAVDCRKIDHLVVAAECAFGTGGLFSLLPEEGELRHWFRFPTWAGPDVVGLWRPLAARLSAELHRSGSPADELLLQLRSAQQADERFFQSLMAMPPSSGDGLGALGRHSHLPATFHVWDGQRLDPGSPLQVAGAPVQIYSPPLLRDARSNFSSLLEAVRSSPSTHFARKFDARRTSALQRRLDAHAEGLQREVPVPLSPLQGWDQSALQVAAGALLEKGAEGPSASREGTWMLKPRLPGALFDLQRLLLDEVLLEERAAFSPSFEACVRAETSAQTSAESICREVALLRYVASIRVGVGWDEERLAFTGPASLIPAAATSLPGASVTAVLYLSGRPRYAPEGGNILLEWHGPSSSPEPRHRSLLRVEAGTAGVWAAGPAGALEAGHWRVSASWLAEDVNAQFLKNFQPEARSHHQAANSLLQGKLQSQKVAVSRPFTVFKDAETLLDSCDRTCLRSYFAQREKQPVVVQLGD